MIKSKRSMPWGEFRVRKKGSTGLRQASKNKKSKKESEIEQAESPASRYQDGRGQLNPVRL